MRAKHFLTLSVLGAAFVAVALANTGCGGGGTSTGGGGSASSSSSTSTSTSSSSSGTTSSSSSSSSGTTSSSSSSSSSGLPAGNHDFSTALDLTLGDTATGGTLVDPATPDFYKFDGTKGERIIVIGLAQNLTGNQDLQDPTVADTVVTVYDSSMKEIALNDDAWPRNNDTDSVLYTQLPADGTYYISVMDCNAYAATTLGQMYGINCASPDNIVTFDYTIQVGDVIETKGSATATPSVLSAYSATSTAGIYYNRVLGGSFAASGEKQSFQFSVPADLKIDAAARPRAYFWVQPIGIADGNGSTSDVEIFVSDDAAGTHVLTDAKQSNYTNGDDPNNGPLQLSFPLDTANLTKPYYIWVKSLATASKPVTDFYFIDHGIGSVFYGEAEATAAHGDMASAQALTVPSGGEGSYFIDANLATPAEQDWYKVDVPAMVTNSQQTMQAPDHVWFGCDVAREGSGLQGFTATLFTSDGATKITGVGPEVLPAVKDLDVGGSGNVTLPAAAVGKAAYIRITATGQDATNTNSSYRCHTYFFTTQ